MLSVGGEPLANGSRAAGEHGGDFRASLEQPRRLAVDHFQVTVLGRVRIVRVHELQHFAFCDRVGGLGHDLHDRLGRQRGHHLECPGVDEIAHQHARLIAEHLIGRVPAAAHR